MAIILTCAMVIFILSQAEIIVYFILIEVVVIQLLLLNYSKKVTKEGILKVGVFPWIG